MSVREWFRPPRQMLTLYLAGTILAAFALVWLGWRLLDQERSLASARAQERLEIAADRAVARLQRSIDQLGYQLSGAGSTPPEGTVVVKADHLSFVTWPAHRLVFYPQSPESAAPTLSTFTPAETVEFGRNNPAQAIPMYRNLARSASLPVKAGALMRLGRCLRKTGNPAAALDIYADLARLGDADVEGIPAELAAREARCTTWSDMGRRDLLQHEARELLRELAAGRWRLIRDRWELMIHEGLTWSGSDITQIQGLEDAAALAQAAESLWIRRRNLRQAGQELSLYFERPVLASWSATSERLAAIFAGRDYLERTRAEAAAELQVRICLADSDGRLILGEVSGLQAIRPASATHLPFTLIVANMNPLTPASEDAGRRRLLAAGLAILGALILGSSYFTFRAIRRELAVGRLQSEFVSAVSHEFRTPLTSMRQLSDMLARGRVPDEGRRQQYYEVLARESERLHRLVEKLLNFGRAEAGAAQYHFESLELVGLIQSVAGEFQRQAEGWRIELSLPDAPRTVRGDREMLSLALWNLLDNAIKYSPECRTVWLSLTQSGGRAAIAVRDQGAGIPHAEQSRIFQKFVRGSTSVAASAKGTGIGLALVQQVAKEHGGEIRLESEPGAGSTFTFILP